MQVTQTAMTQLQQIASTFAADMPTLTAGNAQEVDSIASQAQTALLQVAGLLDTQDAGIYVFGGQDTSNPPVPSPDSHPDLRLLHPDQRRGFRPVGQRRRRHRRDDAGDRRFERHRDLAVFRLHVPAGRRHRPAGRADRRRHDRDHRPAGERQFQRRIHRDIHHRILYARPDARAGHHRLPDAARRPTIRTSPRWCRTPRPA